MFKYYFISKVFPILGGFLFGFFGLGGIFKTTINHAADAIIGGIGLMLMISAIYAAYKIDRNIQKYNP
jgi:preprotein translocase subunit SecY